MNAFKFYFILKIVKTTVKILILDKILDKMIKINILRCNI